MTNTKASIRYGRRCNKKDKRNERDNSTFRPRMAVSK